MPQLTVQDLTVEYLAGDYVVRPLQRRSLQAGDGELLVLLGPSGCGKTTLLSCLAGLLTPTEGSIVLDDVEVTKLSGRQLNEYRRRGVGVVFQAFNLLSSLTAHGNVLAPMLVSGVDRRTARARADELLELVGLADRRKHRPAAMSGGQQQRVAIARALVHDPPLVVADEPTAHLDHVQVEGVLRLIRQLATAGRIVVVATHDERLTYIADRVIELAPGAEGAEREPERVALASGELLFRQGDVGVHVYVVEEGLIELFRERADGTEEQVDELGPGRYFGELAPLLRLPRSATARARADTVVTAYGLRRFRREFPERIGPGDWPKS